MSTDALMAETRELIANGLATVRAHSVSRATYAWPGPTKTTPTMSKLSYWRYYAEAKHDEVPKSKMLPNLSGHVTNKYTGGEDIFAMLATMGVPLAMACDPHKLEHYERQWAHNLHQSIMAAAYQFDLLCGYREQDIDINSDPAKADAGTQSENDDDDRLNVRMGSSVRKIIKFMLMMQGTGTDLDGLKLAALYERAIDEYESYHVHTFNETTRNEPSAFGSIIKDVTFDEVCDLDDLNVNISEEGEKRIRDALDAQSETEQRFIVYGAPEVMPKKEKRPDSRDFSDLSPSEALSWFEMQDARTMVKSVGVSIEPGGESPVYYKLPYSKSVILEATERLLFMDGRQAAESVIEAPLVDTINKMENAIRKAFAVKNYSIVDVSYTANCYFALKYDGSAASSPKFLTERMKRLQEKLDDIGQATEGDRLQYYYATSSYIQETNTLYVWMHDHTAYHSVLGACRQVYAASQVLARVFHKYKDGPNRLAEMSKKFKAVVSKINELQRSPVAAAHAEKELTEDFAYEYMSISGLDSRYLEKMYRSVMGGTIRNSSHTAALYNIGLGEIAGPWLPVNAAVCELSSVSCSLRFLHDLSLVNGLGNVICCGKVAQLCAKHLIPAPQFAGYRGVDVEQLKHVFARETHGAPSRPVDLLFSTSDDGNLADEKRKLFNWLDGLTSTGIYTYVRIPDTDDYSKTYRKHRSAVRSIFNLYMTYGDPVLTQEQAQRSIKDYWLQCVGCSHIYRGRHRVATISLKVTDTVLDDIVQLATDMMLLLDADGHVNDSPFQYENEKHYLAKLQEAQSTKRQLKQNLQDSGEDVDHEKLKDIREMNLVISNMKQLIKDGTSNRPDDDTSRVDFETDYGSPVDFEMHKVWTTYTTVASIMRPIMDKCDVHDTTELYDRLWAAEDAYMDMQEDTSEEEQTRLVNDLVHCQNDVNVFTLGAYKGKVTHHQMALLRAWISMGHMLFDMITTGLVENDAMLYMYRNHHANPNGCMVGKNMPDLDLCLSKLRTLDAARGALNATQNAAFVLPNSQYAVLSHSESIIYIRQCYYNFVMTNDSIDVSTPDFEVRTMSVTAQEMREMTQEDIVKLVSSSIPITEHKGEEVMWKTWLKDKSAALLLEIDEKFARTNAEYDQLRVRWVRMRQLGVRPTVDVKACTEARTALTNAHLAIRDQLASLTDSLSAISKEYNDVDLTFNVPSRANLTAIKLWKTQLDARASGDAPEVVRQITKCEYDDYRADQDDPKQHMRFDTKMKIMQNRIDHCRADISENVALLRTHSTENMYDITDGNLPDEIEIGVSMAKRAYENRNNPSKGPSIKRQIEKAHDAAIRELKAAEKTLPKTFRLEDTNAVRTHVEQQYLKLLKKRNIAHAQFIGYMHEWTQRSEEERLGDIKSEIDELQSQCAGLETALKALQTRMATEQRRFDEQMSNGVHLWWLTNNEHYDDEVTEDGKYTRFTEKLAALSAHMDKLQADVYEHNNAIRAKRRELVDDKVLLMDAFEQLDRISPDQSLSLKDVTSKEAAVLLEQPKPPSESRDEIMKRACVRKVLAVIIENHNTELAIQKLLDEVKVSQSTLDKLYIERTSILTRQRIKKQIISPTAVKKEEKEGGEKEIKDTEVQVLGWLESARLAADTCLAIEQDRYDRYIEFTTKYDKCAAEIEAQRAKYQHEYNVPELLDRYEKLYRLVHKDKDKLMRTASAVKDTLRQELESPVTNMLNEYRGVAMDESPTTTVCVDYKSNLYASFRVMTIDDMKSEYSKLSERYGSPSEYRPIDSDEICTNLQRRWIDDIASLESCHPTVGRGPPIVVPPKAYIEDARTLATLLERFPVEWDIEFSLPRQDMGQSVRDLLAPDNKVKKEHKPYVKREYVKWDNYGKGKGKGTGKGNGKYKGKGTFKPLAKMTLQEVEKEVIRLGLIKARPNRSNITGSKKIAGAVINKPVSDTPGLDRNVDPNLQMGTEERVKPTNPSFELGGNTSGIVPADVKLTKQQRKQRQANANERQWQEREQKQLERERLEANNKKLYGLPDAVSNLTGAQKRVQEEERKKKEEMDEDRRQYYIGLIRKHSAEMRAEQTRERQSHYTKKRPQSWVAPSDNKGKGGGTDGNEPKKQINATDPEITPDVFSSAYGPWYDSLSKERQEKEDKKQKAYWATQSWGRDDYGDRSDSDDNTTEQTEKDESDAAIRKAADAHNNKTVVLADPADWLGDSEDEDNESVDSDLIDIVKVQDN